MPKSSSHAASAAYGVLSSYNARRRFRQLGATDQCIEFSTLFLEREQ